MADRRDRAMVSVGDKHPVRVAWPKVLERDLELVNERHGRFPLPRVAILMLKSVINIKLQVEGRGWRELRIPASKRPAAATRRIRLTRFARHRVRVRSGCNAGRSHQFRMVRKKFLNGMLDQTLDRHAPQDSRQLELLVVHLGNPGVELNFGFGFADGQLELGRGAPRRRRAVFLGSRHFQ